MAATDDPSTWGTREAAALRGKVLPKPFRAGGVGLVLGNYQGLAVGGVDLDTCLADTGETAPWAREVIGPVQFLTELSPSGAGAKVFFLFNPADEVAIREAMGPGEKGELKRGRQWKRSGTTDHPPAIELYTSHRFFAVTDQLLEGSTAELRPVELHTILWLIREAGPAFSRDKALWTETFDWGRPRGGDQSRSARAFRAACQVHRRGGTFEDFIRALDDDSLCAAWRREKGDDRQLKRCWEKAGQAVESDAPAWLEHCQRTREGEAGGICSTPWSRCAGMRKSGISFAWTRCSGLPPGHVSVLLRRRQFFQ